MAATTIGNTAATTIISDNATPGSGTYAWYIVTEAQGGVEPRAPIAAIDLAAQTNILKKNFDFTAVYRMSNIPVQSAVDFDNLRDALDYWDANDTRLFLSVKNTWSANLATRGTKAVPTTQNQYRGKLLNFRWEPKSNEVIVGIEFHYTTA